MPLPSVENFSLIGCKPAFTLREKSGFQSLPPIPTSQQLLCLKAIQTQQGVKLSIIQLQPVCTILAHEGGELSLSLFHLRRDFMTSVLLLDLQAEPGESFHLMSVT